MPLLRPVAKIQVPRYYRSMAHLGFAFKPGWMKEYSAGPKVVGTQVDRIIRESERLLMDEAEYQKMARASCPYGDGKAAQRIVERIKESLG